MRSELVNDIWRSFKEQFGEEPLLVKSPGRINIIGEHTDYNEGFVMPAAINKYIVAALSKREDDRCLAYAFNMNERFAFNLGKVTAVEEVDWKNYVIGVVGELQKMGRSLGGFNLVFGGDIPKGSGMSSSAALENSIVFGLNELFQLGLSKKEMIYVSQMAEHNYVGVKCGIMDQYASMFGKKNQAIFLDCRSLEARSIPIELKDYRFILINTHVSHNLAEAAYNDRRAVCERIATRLKVKALRDATVSDLENLRGVISEEEFQMGLYIVEENERVQKAALYLENHDLDALGRLLFDAHKGVRDQYKVSCEELDFLVEFAEQSPWIMGARMMGGGFGGCTINLIKNEEVEIFSKDVSTAFENRFDHKCSVYMVRICDGTRLV